MKRADEWEMAREKTAARRNKNIAPTHMLDCFVGWIAAFYGELHECSFDVDGSGGRCHRLHGASPYRTAWSFRAIPPRVGVLSRDYRCQERGYWTWLV